MKKIGLLLMMLALSSLAIAADGVTWLTLSEGAARAKSIKKPMIIDFFYGKGCHRCDKLVQDSYNDPAIAKRIMTDFIPIRIDLSKELSKEEEALGKKYDYKEECLLLFLDSDGNILNDREGKHLSCATTIETDMLTHYLDLANDSPTGKGK